MGAITLVHMDNWKPTINDWVPVENWAAHKDHSIARHRRRWSIVDIVHLKDDFTVWCHWNTVTISQGQGLVVIKDRVQVLYPNGIDRSIQQQPNMITLKQNRMTGYLESDQELNTKKIHMLWSQENNTEAKWNNSHTKTFG